MLVGPYEQQRRAVAAGFGQVEHVERDTEPSGRRANRLDVHVNVEPQQREADPEVVVQRGPVG
jgi:hypothetical protein